VARRVRRLRAKWAAVPFEAKLAMFVAPVFVSVASALILRFVVNENNSAPSSGEASIRSTEPSRPVLRATLNVVNGPEGPTAVDVVVHNLGRQRVAIPRADVRVRDLLVIRRCVDPGHKPPLTGTVDVELPTVRAKGDVIPLNVGRVENPDEEDSFRLAVGTTGAVNPDRPHFYVLDLTFTAEGGAVLKAGSFVVAIPFPKGLWLFTAPRPPAEEPIATCLARNRKALASVFERAATASPALHELEQNLPPG
jgi:hypothetical protein